MLERYICVEINEKVKEGASELESAVFDRYDFINVLGKTTDVGWGRSSITHQTNVPPWCMCTIFENTCFQKR